MNASPAKLYGNNSRGFTLIELLVVMSIISVLASLSLVSLTITREKARLARQQVEVHEAMNDIALQRSKGTNKYDLPISTDSYFTIDSGSYALSNVSDGDGYVLTQIAPLPRSYAFSMTDPNSAASASFYYYNGNWRKSGSPINENFSSTFLTPYFMIRNESTAPISIILPSNVTYHGTTVQNGTPRPW